MYYAGLNANAMSLFFALYFCIVCNIQVSKFMNIWKFIKSFHSMNTYLIFSFSLLFLITTYFYYINPK
ncbi:MAG TPA: hypothetical protein DEF26_12450 [Acinetobacter sp.]|nr:hypothetical protein [Acinetobacter sp.]